MLNFTCRFILRVLPIEVACYASEEEISRAIKPLVEQYFPEGTENPHKVIWLSSILTILYCFLPFPT